MSSYVIRYSGKYLGFLKLSLLPRKTKKAAVERCNNATAAFVPMYQPVCQSLNKFDPARGKQCNFVVVGIIP